MRKDWLAQSFIVAMGLISAVWAAVLLADVLQIAGVAPTQVETSAIVFASIMAGLNLILTNSGKKHSRH
jgi:hypothetical protein